MKGKVYVRKGTQNWLDGTTGKGHETWRQEADQSDFLPGQSNRSWQQKVSMKLDF